MNRAEHIPPEAYSGLPIRVEHRDPNMVFHDWDHFQKAGFEVFDMGPRAAIELGAMGMPAMVNGFTAQWIPNFSEVLK